MRKVYVSYEVFVAQSKEHPLVIATPDYVFSGEFDKSASVSFKELCDLEYKVEQLAKSFKSLGCQVSVLCKETSHLDIG